MPQKYKSPLFWAKILRDVLVAVSAISTLTDPRFTLGLLIIREAVGKFVQYSEEEDKPKTTKA